MQLSHKHQILTSPLLHHQCRHARDYIPLKPPNRIMQSTQDEKMERFVRDDVLVVAKTQLCA